MNEFQRKIDRLAAAPMFAASLAFLVPVAEALPYIQTGQVEDLYLGWILWPMGLLYPLFVGELLVHLVAGSRFWKQHLLFCLIPPMRMGARDHVEGDFIWLPRIGWAKTDRQLQRRAEKAFSGPMVAIALMILPLLVLEFWWLALLSDNSLLAMAWQIGTSIIWLAFAIEFIVMVSIVDKKIRYCREHWIDLVIILLPLIMFLRLMRLTSLFRMNRLSRVYRLRGLAMRMLRALLVLDMIGRLFHVNLQRRVTKLKELLAEKQQEIQELREEIETLELQIEAAAKDSPDRPTSEPPAPHVSATPHTTRQSGNVR